MTVTKLLDGTSIATIDKASKYEQLPQGDHEVLIYVIGSDFSITRTEKLELKIVDRVT